MGLSNSRLNAQVAVTDMTRAAEFYEGQLGLTAVQVGADGSRVYASGDDEALVVYPSPENAGRSTATLATWYVDDVEQVVDELTSNGVTFERYEGVLESGFDYGTDQRGISPRAVQLDEASGSTRLRERAPLDASVEGSLDQSGVEDKEA